MSDEPASSNYKTPGQLRAQAYRARQLANGLLPSDETARRLRQVAAELEEKANALERQTRLG
jgi:hypothetical protein